MARELPKHRTSDAHLLELSAGGDRAAFGIFMNRHASAVHRLLLSLNAQPADAEDALQECFISAWRSAVTFADSGTARGWLFAIARNALRRQHRRRVDDPEDFDSLEVLGERAGWGTRSDFVERLAAHDELEWALARLSMDQQEVIRLRDIAGLSGEETAEALELSLAAMKSRLHRARLELMGILRAEVGRA